LFKKALLLVFKVRYTGIAQDSTNGRLLWIESRPFFPDLLSIDGLSAQSARRKRRWLP
jgi:hypothetical protein